MWLDRVGSLWIAVISYYSKFNHTHTEPSTTNKVIPQIVHKSPNYVCFPRNDMKFHPGPKFYSVFYMCWKRFQSVIPTSLFPRMERLWQEELRTKGPEAASFGKVMFKAFKTRVLIGLIFSIISALLVLANPVSDLDITLLLLLAIL